jgi:hypothetical protein
MLSCTSCIEALPELCTLSARFQWALMHTPDYVCIKITVEDFVETLAIERLFTL